VAQDLVLQQARFDFSLDEHLHYRGVNMRYLHLLYNRVKAVVLEPHQELNRACWLLLIGSEMYSRLCKRELRELLRAARGHEFEDKEVLARFLTTLRTSYHWWNTRGRELLQSEPGWGDCEPTYNVSDMEVC
jgi:hypothetical protein